MPRKRLPDFTVYGLGTSVVLLTPHTRAARRWVRTNLPADALTLGRGIAVEPRYVAPILDGITTDGLTVGPTA